MYENRMLGVPRMRQLKVGETSCMHNVNPDFLSAIRFVVQFSMNYTNIWQQLIEHNF